MKKTKNDQNRKKPRTMLGQEVGSMLDKKTNQDFNNEHPNHDENGLIKGNSDVEEKKFKTKNMKKPITHTYHVNGMSCGGCATTVKNKLSAAPSVTSVQVDLAKKEADITSSQAIEIDKLQEALSNTGYSISELRDPISL